MVGKSKLTQNSNLPVGGLAAAILVVFFRLPSHVKPAEATFREKMLQLDPIGITLIMGAVVCYILALQWGGLTLPWSSSTIIGLFVGFGLLLVCFCFDQWYMEERAMLPMRLLKDRYIWQGMMYSFTIAGTYFLVLYFLPLYFQVIDNVSPIQSGVRNLPLILGITLATVASGIGITVTGRPMPFMVVAGVLSTIGVGLLFTLTIGSSSAKWIGYQVITGLGLGLGFQVPVSAVQATLPQIDIPSGSAMIICKSSLPSLKSSKYTNMTSCTNNRRRIPCLCRRSSLRIRPHKRPTQIRFNSRPVGSHRHRRHTSADGI